jgi:tetratricopeptide (TPR) repeat protein
LGCGCLLVLLFAVPAIYTGTRYFLDKRNYEKAHLGYQQADCAAAITLYDGILKAWRPFDTGSYAALAQQERAECLPFQAAVEKQHAGTYDAALLAFTDYINGRPESVLTRAARGRIAALFDQPGPATLASAASCERTDAFLDLDLIPQRETNLPDFYLACGQVFEKAKSQEYAFAMYVLLLSQFPEDSLAPQAEAALLGSPVVCEKIDFVRASQPVANRLDFMPTLYRNCGQAYEVEGDWASAVSTYETFLTDFPSHALAKEIEAALARSLVEQARASGAGEIAAPEASGSTGSELATVIIQNDSPEKMRIVFSGADARVEELEACATCIKFAGQEPDSCPNLGPTGTYTVTPGAYDVLVESISDTHTTPWTGTWELAAGSEYSNCFYIVTGLLP